MLNKELDKFVELGLRDYLIPINITYNVKTKKYDKKPSVKKFYANGKTEWRWKKNPITGQYIKWSDQELLDAKAIGINHEASGLVAVDGDAPECSDFMSAIPPTLTVTKGNSIRQKLYKVNGNRKTTKYKHKDKTVIEVLTNTQSWLCGEGKQINNVKPAEIQFEDLLNQVKKINAWSILSRHIPPHGSRDDFYLALAGFIARDTDWSVSDGERFVETLAERNDDDVNKVSKKISAQKKNLEEGKKLWGVEELSKMCKVNLPCMDEFKAHKDSPKADLKPLVTFGLGKFIERSYPPIVYYLYPLSSTEQLVQIFGPPGQGKTLFAMEMAWNESQGLDFMHFKFNKEIKIPPPVLYVEGEMSATQLQERVATMIDRDKNKKIYDLNNFEIAVLREQPNENFTKLIEEDGRKKVELSAEAIFKRRGIKPIIYIDNIRMLMGMFDEKDSVPWIPFVGWLAQMRARGYTVKFLHHSTNEGSKASGSGLKEANLNLNIQLGLPKDDELLDLDEDYFTQIKFEAKKWREVHIGWQKPFIMSVDKRTMEWKKHPLLTKTQRKIKEELDKGKKPKDIIDDEKNGFSKANVYKTIKILNKEDKENDFKGNF